MFTTLKTAALSAVIGLGTLAAIPATAQADGLYLNFGGKHDNARVGVYLGDNGHAVRRNHDRWDRWERRNHRKPAQCTTDRAVDKAERLGLRRARVADVSRHSITVAGRKFGDRVYVTFGKSPSCPIIG